MPNSFSKSITSLFGCPYLLSAPTDITAYSGETNPIKDFDEEVFEPWCPTFKTSLFNFSPSVETRYSSIFCGESPVNKNSMSP